MIAITQGIGPPSRACGSSSANSASVAREADVDFAHELKILNLLPRNLRVVRLPLLDLVVIAKEGVEVESEVVPRGVKPEARWQRELATKHTGNDGRIALEHLADAMARMETVGDIVDHVSDNGVTVSW